MTAVADATTAASAGVAAQLGDALASATRSALTSDPTKPSVLVSAALACAPIAPLDWFTTARELGEDAACWLEPTIQRSFVGVGVATSVTLIAPDRFRTAASTWAEMLTHHIVVGAGSEQPGAGPILLGGATFADAVSTDACWAGFETGRLDVPAILLGIVDDACVLTCSLMVERAIDPSPEIAHLVDRVGRLLAALESQATRPPGDTTQALRQVGGHPDRSTWSSSVARAAGAVGRGRIDKVVLARRADLLAPAPIDADAVLRRLVASPPATSPPNGAPVTVFAFGREGRTFLGASPERLVAVTGRSFRTIALAGTTGRDPDRVRDGELATTLLASEKDREEHAVVVDMLRETLAPLAGRLDIDRSPHVVQLPTLQHLASDISGELHDDLGILDLVARLHPTPAVGGWPRAAALELLEEQEHLDRGWYAGPVGWVDARGDGEFVVAIRSGVIAEDQAHLFVGCGIVADSEPDREWAESSMKLQSLATAIGRLDP
jgi:menaquinone-specific isochorismate synthase